MRPHTLGMLGKGFKVAGEKNGMARLTANLVRSARHLHRRLGFSTYFLAANWGVAESTVRRAVQRKTWRRVK